MDLLDVLGWECSDESCPIERVEKFAGILEECVLVVSCGQSLPLGMFLLQLPCKFLPGSHMFTAQCSGR